MGLFGGYSKPGPGIDKDVAKKKGLFLYMELFFRKFWKLMAANGLYVLCSLPFLVLLYIVAPISSDTVARVAQSIIMEGSDPVQMQSAVSLTMRVMFATGIFTLLGFGIFAPGYSYTLRCVTREQHAWIWSDFKDKIKENWKQGLWVTIIDIVVLFFGLNALMFYFTAFSSTGQSIWLFVSYALTLILVLYGIAHFYLYQLMITFHSTVRELYKNAIILVFAKLPMNFLLTAIAALLFVLAFLFINPLATFILFGFIWLTVMRFPFEFYAARVIEREIIGAGEMRKKADKREQEGLE